MYNPNLHFHFTGIGGAGMAGLAEVLLNLGFSVSGSDLSVGEACRRLQKLGAQIFKDHAAEHVPQSASLVVYSSAVALDNVELVEARSRKLPVIRRAEVLAELMRLKYGIAVAGSHGKTTTTSLIGHVLEECGLDPTVIIGGQVKSKGTGSRVGKGEFLVAESDESDKSFLLLKPSIAVVTNIDAEHLSAYSSLVDLEKAFAEFVSAVPFYGLSILCADDQRVRDLCARVSGRKITYGLSPDAELRAEGIEQFQGKSTFDVFRGDSRLGRVELPMPGRHLVTNALAAIGVGLELGLSAERVLTCLSSFSGVARRLEIVGKVNGATVMSDYGHHPTEIKATLRAIRDGWKDIRTLWTVFQPHRYSRTKECFIDFLDAFQDTDKLVVTDIYSAGEAELEGVTGDKLFEAIRHPQKEFCSQLDQAVGVIRERASEGDLILCLGAGSIGTMPVLLKEALLKDAHPHA